MFGKTAKVSRGHEVKEVGVNTDHQEWFVCRKCCQESPSPKSGKNKLTDRPPKKWSAAGGKDDEPGHGGDQDGAEIITTSEVRID